VLNKPGALSEEERAWIQQHPVVGSDIVGRAPSLRGALEVIRQHHERFDGHGYPDGLAGEQISLAARIVAVVDVWDALPSDRAYRPAWPADRALGHLAAGRGTHFDPNCLDAFLALMAERGHRPGSGEATTPPPTRPPRPATTSRPPPSCRRHPDTGIDELVGVQVRRLQVRLEGLALAGQDRGDDLDQPLDAAGS
jgi:hypothetical protein